MAAFSVTPSAFDDPRKLRTLLARASDLARAHELSSVLVGLSAEEGDLVFPDFVDYLQSALRIEDALFRMTRERAVLHLADVDVAQAREVIERLTGEFAEQLAAAEPPRLRVGYFEISPRCHDVTVKQVLTAVFSGGSHQPPLH